MKSKILFFSPFILLIFHVIGFVIFVKFPEFNKLSFLNILLCGVLVFLSEEITKKTLLLFFVVFVLGYLLELIGTQTGYLFGNYIYGDALGLKLYGVPLIIGVNWFVIVSVSCNLFRSFTIPIFLHSVLAGLIATFLDFLIEPVAIAHDFWMWNEDMIPPYNYLCWFIFSTAFSYLYLKLSSEKNQTAYYLALIWILFFGILNLV